MVNAIAHETSKAIIEDLGNGFFSILVDESRDISVKEQMAHVLRYVNKQGIIIERFLGIVHVASTTALSLKCAIEGLLCEHNLSLSRLSGQGYDGASNMQVTVVRGSCKRRDALRDTQFAKIKEDLENSVRRSGQGLNQETNLKRPVSGRPRCNTQQNTNLHYYCVELFYTVIDMQLQELNNHFSEVNTDLLICMACLNPSNSFVAFDKEKLIHLTKFYPYDFPETDILALDSQLQNFIFDMRNNDLFLELQGVVNLLKS
ncbi:uncharacterized protein LOC142629353 [Castanea sativa]|uniref:uncharacterized protein LOC142629353 n=1 Tax=Castanea sativa TaxID=21020 RepID=UPI003F65479D